MEGGIEPVVRGSPVAYTRHYTRVSWRLRRSAIGLVFATYYAQSHPRALNEPAIWLRPPGPVDEGFIALITPIAKMLPWAEDNENEDESCLDDRDHVWRGGDVHPEAQDIRSGGYWRNKAHDTFDIDALIKKVHAENVRDVRGGL